MPTAPAWRLLCQLSAHRWHLAWVALLMVASVIGEVSVPYFFGHLSDLVAAEDQMASAWYLALLGIGSALAEFCCDLSLVGILGTALGHLQVNLFGLVLKQPLGTLRAAGTGALSARLTGDVDATQELLAQNLGLLLWYLARGIGHLLALAWLCPALASLTLLALPALLLLPRQVGKVQQRLAQQIQDALADATKVALETFQAMPTVRSFAYEVGTTKRYQDRLCQLYQLEFKDAATYAANLWASGLLVVALKLGTLCYGGHLVATGGISPGHLLTALICQKDFTQAVEVLLHYSPNLAKAVGASAKTFELLDQCQQLAPEGTLAPEHLQGHLQLQDLCFSYPGQEEPVLRGVSLELRPGEVVAVVAPPGAGKSTLVALALGLMPPSAGKVLLDGRPLADYQRHYLRCKLTAVPQQPLLFARSLRANITYGAGHRSLAQVVAASSLAGANHFATLLPRGYDTELGELGGQLSGGQCQAVAIARALLREPKVLLLDEPSSALDAGRRCQVEQELLGDARLGRATLLVTGQVELALRAQRVAVLEGGQLRELSDPQELLSWQQEQPGGE